MNYEQHKIPPAEKRYPDLFAFLDSAIGYLSEVIDVGSLPIPSTNLAFVRFTAVIRAFNLLKSIRQLLASDHWENAAILMRSLFELVLNVEDVTYFSANEASFRFGTPTGSSGAIAIRSRR